MFADKPGLKLIRAQDVADHHVIRSMVANFVSLVSYLPAFADDDLMSVEQAR